MDYDLRDPRILAEVLYKVNYTFFSPLARLQREWNALDSEIRGSNTVAEFKNNYLIIQLYNISTIQLT